MTDSLWNDDRRSVGCGQCCGLIYEFGKLGEMKSFYSRSVVEESGGASSAAQGSLLVSMRARVAVYDGPASAPRVEELDPAPVGEYIEALSSRVYELARSQGGVIPYTVVREVAENLIHADFAEPVVSILNSGNTIRFADQGPGIQDKDRAMLPGFTTASSAMKDHIRGVGSGLPIVRDYLAFSGGVLVIEDNLGSGSVITIDSFRPTSREPSIGSVAPAVMTQPTEVTAPEFSLDDNPLPVAGPRLSTRQKQVLALVMESGSAGPSLVAKELGVAISTAYRDLASLEEMGLISADGGKRQLTSDGMSYLNGLMAGSA